MTDVNLNIRMHNVNAVRECIPKRCEMFVDIECEDNCDLVVMNGELCEGVFAAGMIVRPVQGKIRVKILNVNDWISMIVLNLKV